jgi:hypothetical protein
MRSCVYNVRATMSCTGRSHEGMRIESGNEERESKERKKGWSVAESMSWKLA